MELTKAQLEQIQTMSKLLFPSKSIAIVIGVDIQEFMKECRKESSEAFKAYMKGRLETEILLREKIIDYSIKGSVPAQTMAIKFLDESAAKLNER